MDTMNTFLDNLATIANGHFLTVTFKKLDGTKRTINGRFGVKRYLKGGKATTDASKYMVIYSIKDKGYRCINKDTIEAINVNGMRIVHQKLNSERDSIHSLYTYINDFIIAVGKAKAEKEGINIELIVKLGNTDNTYSNESERKLLITMAHSVHDYYTLNRSCNDYCS